MMWTISHIKFLGLELKLRRSSRSDFVLASFVWTWSWWSWGHGEDAEEEEPSDVEPENQVPTYRQESKNLLATLFSEKLNCCIEFVFWGCRPARASLGFSLAKTCEWMQDSKRTKQSTCSSERSDRWIYDDRRRLLVQLKVAVSENAEEGRSPLPDAGLRHLPTEEEATKDV